jgi:FkbM family methyltransferase
MQQRTSFLQRLESRVRRDLGLPPRFEAVRFLGQELVLSDGVVPPVADYDDAWLLACTKHATSMFDVGSNVGLSSIIALTNPAMEHVVLVEANSSALSLAATNLIRNQLSVRARFVCAFASDRADDAIDLWTVGTGAAGSMYRGHATTASKEGRSIRVPTTTLDELSKRFDVIPELVKIDVEGAEQQVLRGASRLTRQNSTRYLVEMHSPPELPMRANAEAVLAWCRELSFSAWYLTDGSLLTTPEPIAHRGRCHLLLQPSAWPFPEWLAGIEQSAPLPTS